MSFLNIPRGIIVLAMAALIAGCGGDEPVQPTPDPSPTPSPTPSTVAVTGVSLNKSSISLEVGASESLTATVTPDNATDKTVSWKSSDTGVATVDGAGKVTAVKAGSATITVTASDGSRTSTCTVTVKDKTVILSKLELEPEEITLLEGESKQLKVIYTPEDATDKSIKWESGNTQVATVDGKGLVKAVGQGNVHIFATATNGVRATCLVSVKKDLSLKGIAFVVDNVEVNLGIPVQLELVFNPEDAENKEVTWKSSNTAVAKVSSDGLVEGLKEGQARITATSKDGGYTATCNVNVTSILKAGVYWREDSSLYHNDERLGIYAPFGICIDPSNNIYYYDMGKIFWNGAPVIDFKMDVSSWYSAAGGGFYFVVARDNQRRSLYALKVDPAKEKIDEIKLFEGSKNNSYWVHDATADSNGNLYVSGYSAKGSNGSAASLWKIDKNNKVTHTLLTDGTSGERESCDAVAVNKNGDVFCLAWDGTYTGSYYNINLYKNGKKVRRVSSQGNRQATQSCDLAVVGNDVYAIVCENAGEAYVNRVRVYKNDKVLYTLKEGERTYAGDIFVTSKGDVYCISQQEIDGKLDRIIWKNGKVLYTSHDYPSIHSLVVKE